MKCKDLEERDFGIINYYSDFCLDGLNKTTKNTCSCTWCPDQNLNRAPPDHTAQALLLLQPALAIKVNPLLY
jgi:hypothetical protein